ncbi:hypothetical protein JXD20_04295 [Candidatus Peregrinibacteria bacterium]|nr:hypothetical protein [Candidatus Peregrinibacteria bacterium]
MTENPTSKPPSQAPKLPEILTFDEGLKEVRRRIDRLFKSQNVISVAINGSSSNVGKTRLSGQLTSDLLGSHIPTGLCGDPSLLLTARTQLYTCQEFFDDWIHQVYILSA